MERNRREVEVEVAGVAEVEQVYLQGQEQTCL
jgi:hypothetical protein